jgi:pimeloyl-ACP methyl ester carboxylesterase
MRILFLHGAGLTSAMWRPQLDALAGEFDVAAEDLPGHGTRSDEKFSFPAAVELVAALASAGPPTVLVGLSLGGYVAMATAAQHLELPAGLVLTGASVDYSRFADRIVAFTGEMFQRVWPKRMLRNAQEMAFRKRYPDWVNHIGARDHYWRGYADALRAARRVHWHECLTAYERPVLVLNGELDKPHVRAQQELVAQAPNARAQVITGAGHLANLDRPEEYTEAVRAFVRATG